MQKARESRIVGRIRSVHAGEVGLPHRVADLLAEREKREELTALEIEVLELLVKGRSNNEIADGLHVSEAAVKFRLKGLFSKLRVQDRTEAVVSALRHGIIHLENKRPERVVATAVATVDNAITL